MNEATTSDPVEHGIREWQKLKAAAEEALERCRKAETECAYLRGQNELLQSQKRGDDEDARQVQQHGDEMELMVNALGAAVLGVIDKRQQGYYRRAGSIENGTERLRAFRESIGARPTIEDVETGLHELVDRMADRSKRQQQIKTDKVPSPKEKHG